MTLESDTGKNDNNSVWGSGLLQTIKGWTDVGAGVYNTVTGRNQKPAAAAPAVLTAQPAQQPTWTKYLPWVIGGVVVLVILALVVKK